MSWKLSALKRRCPPKTPRQGGGTGSWVLVCPRHSRLRCFAGYGRRPEAVACLGCRLARWRSWHQGESRWLNFPIWVAIKVIVPSASAWCTNYKAKQAKTAGTIVRGPQPPQRSPKITSLVSFRPKDPPQRPNLGCVKQGCGSCNVMTIEGISIANLLILIYHKSGHQLLSVPDRDLAAQPSGSYNRLGSYNKATPIGGLYMMTRARVFVDDPF